MAVTVQMKDCAYPTPYTVAMCMLMAIAVRMTMVTMVTIMVMTMVVPVTMVTAGIVVIMCVGMLSLFGIIVCVDRDSRVGLVCLGLGGVVHTVLPHSLCLSK